MPCATLKNAVSAALLISLAAGPALSRPDFPGSIDTLIQAGEDVRVIQIHHVLEETQKAAARREAIDCVKNYAYLAPGSASDRLKNAVAHLNPLAAQDAEARGALIGLLGSARATHKIMAIEALAAVVRVPEVNAAVLSLVKEGDSQSRKIPVVPVPWPRPHPAPPHAGDVSLHLVRKAAISALAPIVKEAPAVRAAILDRLGDENYEVRSLAVKSLHPLVTRDAEVKDSLRKMLRDSQQGVRNDAAAALAAFCDDKEIALEIFNHAKEVATPILTRCGHRPAEL
ncbi:MAG: HEAT repeat domain-containing protein [Elusimicrobia bacterium]|nr:HEAT repeat domain-containing protein [Elusimicrobiota bacterium]